MTEILNDVKIGVWVVLLFGAAIFVHEFGHYWVARRRGMKVEAFAIGFGPKIFSWVRDGIEYSVRWIPAGGFVKLPQMITSAAIEGDAGDKEVPPAPPLSKILVSVAGPAMNVVFAFVIAFVLFWVGLPVQVNPSIIGYVEPGTPEAALGIRDGDEIVAVNGQPVSTWEEVNNITALALTNVLPVAIKRDGKTNTYPLKAEANEAPEVRALIDIKTLNLYPRDPLVVKNIKAGSAAEKAHLQTNDEVVNFAGVPISGFRQLTNLLQECAGHSTPLVVKRGGELLTLTVTPATEVTIEKGRLGVNFGFSKDVYVLQHPTPWAQISDVFRQLTGTISALAHSHTSGVKASDLAGPVGIISFLAVKVNTDYRLALGFLVMLNINLAILNLLPMPVLDGGHIMMAVLERIRRRPLNVRVVEYATTVFAVLLISFMIYVTFFDLRRLPLIRVLFSQESQIQQTVNPTPPAANPAR
jgi:regulator of sigma E protease